MHITSQNASAGQGVCRTCSGSRMIMVKLPNGNYRKAPCPACKGVGMGYATK